MHVHALPAPVRVHMLTPLSFNDAQEIGDRIKSGSSVFMDLRNADHDLEERLRDFVGGLTSALEGSVTDVAHGIILVAPAGVNVSGMNNSQSDSSHTSHSSYSDYRDESDITPLFGRLSA
jgi:FtsZ-interacting cell division protein YlmF